MKKSSNKSSDETASEPPSGRLDANQASRRLGVRRDTLYAYVSRGLIRSETQRGTRARLRRRFDPIVDRWLDEFLTKVLASGNDSRSAVAARRDPVAIESQSFSL